MSEYSEQDKSPVPSHQGEPDVLALLKKIQQQLAFLEKKIDTLVGQSQDRPPFRGKSFSRPPHRSFGGGPRHGEGNRDRDRHGPAPRDRGFNQGGPSHFDKGPRDDHRGGFGAPRKKPFFQQRRRERS